ncbi:MAG: hydrogenase maturation nickel metallochaperone HypA [Minicystis sp.]
MHESTVARRILSAVLDRAGAARVCAAHGWVAETEALSPESLALHFSAHARGTRAEGARLELRLVRIDAHCRGCGVIYTPEHHLLLCPRCGGVDAELLGEEGIGIDALEVE